MSKYLSKTLEALSAYTPGEQPQDKSYIKLNTNENPFYPSKRALSKINKAELKKLRLYSDPEAKELVSAIADYYGVTSDNVTVSNGSDEILAFCFRAFCDGKNGIRFPDITYGFYPVYSNLFNIKTTVVPLKDDFSVDEKDYFNAGETVIIANPNAPTGLALTISQIEEIVKSNLDNVVIIDEAYVDFGAESAVPLTKKYDNLIVVQTFSKSRALAGARVGFAIASKALTEDLKKIKFSFNPYNLNRLSILLGAGAMRDKKYFLDSCQKVIESREFTVAELKKLGLTVLDSKANFLFVKGNRLKGKDLYLELKNRGILVRFLSGERIKDYVRISVGSIEQMKLLIDNLKEIEEAK